MTRARRPAFVAWTSSPGRSRELAAALGGDAIIVYPLQSARPAAKALRYLVSIPLTFARLLAARPSAVVVQNPPAFAAACAWLYAVIARIPFVMDVHPGGFGLQGDALSARLLPITRWLIRRARATLVTESTLAAQVRAWGGEPLIVHEAPPAWRLDTPLQRDGAGEVLLIGTFGRDEPIELAVRAATTAGVPLAITGDLADAPAALRDAPPSGVRLTGYLRGDAFVRALESAAAVLVLSTEPTSVPRAGYEAVRAGRPLVISRSDATVEAFPRATHVDHDVEPLAAALRRVIATPPSDAQLQRARVALEAQWDAQRDALELALQAGTAPTR